MLSHVTQQMCDVEHGWDLIQIDGFHDVTTVPLVSALLLVIQRLHPPSQEWTQMKQIKLIHRVLIFNAQ